MQPKKHFFLIASASFIIFKEHTTSQQLKKYATKKALMLKPERL